MSDVLATLPREKRYKLIIEQLEQILEEGFEQRFHKILQRFLHQVFNYAAPNTCQKILLSYSSISLIICILLIFVDAHPSLSLKEFISGVLPLTFQEFTLVVLLSSFITSLIYSLSLLSACQYFSPKSENVRYIKIVTDRIIYRKKTPLEKEFLPDFDSGIIEYTVANLALFPENDLKYVEMFFESQAKLSTKNIQYGNKLLVIIISLMVALITNDSLRPFIVALLLIFFYLFDYFIQKGSISARSSICLQLLKEAQLRRNQANNLHTY